MYLVAVVGRPNVGKSTLFNRIIQRREAIVEDTPGVTRDRIYSDAEWNGRRFTIIDTGGIVPRSDDVIEKAIREQAQMAIEEADSIVFVCDAKDGVTATDRDIASILRRTKKRVTLAVNKCDNPSFDLQTIMMIDGMPKWTPGKQNGTEVNCYITLTVKYGQ